MSHLKAYCLYHNDQAITNFCKDSTPPLTQKTALCRCAPLAFANTPNIIKISKPNRPILASTKRSLKSKNLSMLLSRNWNKIIPNAYAEIKHRLKYWRESIIGTTSSFRAFLKPKRWSSVGSNKNFQLWRRRFISISCKNMSNLVYSPSQKLKRWRANSTISLHNCMISMIPSRLRNF